jgi:hypothetical protein
MVNVFQALTGCWMLDVGYWILDGRVNLEGVYFELSLNQ